MTRAERRARRRARGDARARRARPRTIDPFTKKPRSRFFERPLFFVSLSRRFRSGVGGGVGFGFARRFRSDSPFPHSPRPSMRCSRRSTRGARATTRRRRRTRPRGGVTWTLSSAKCAPETCTPCFHRAGGTTTPTCACRRSAGSTTSLSRTPETPVASPAVFVPAAPAAAGRRLLAPPPPCPAPAFRGVSPSGLNSIPLGPATCRDAVSPGAPRRHEPDGAPGPPHALGARKNASRLRSLAPAEGAARATASPPPRRGRGALQRARRVRGGRCGAADAAAAASARRGWTPRSGAARGAGARGKRLPKTSKDASSKDAPREEGDVAAGLRRWLRDDAPAAAGARDAAAAAVPAAPAAPPDARRHPFRPRGVRRDQVGRGRRGVRGGRAAGRARPDAAPIGTRGLAPPPAGPPRRARARRARVSPPPRALAPPDARGSSSAPPSASGQAPSPSSARSAATPTFLVTPRRRRRPRGPGRQRRRSPRRRRRRRRGEGELSWSPRTAAAATAALERSRARTRRRCPCTRPCCSTALLAGQGGGRAAQRHAADAVDLALAASRAREAAAAAAVAEAKGEGGRRGEPPAAAAARGGGACVVQKKAGVARTPRRLGVFGAVARAPDR